MRYIHKVGDLPMFIPSIPEVFRAAQLDGIESLLVDTTLLLDRLEAGGIEALPYPPFGAQRRDPGNLLESP